MGPGGGSEKPDTDPRAEAILFVVEGSFTLTLDGNIHELEPGSYVFIPPSSSWSVVNNTDQVARFHWMRKAYEAVEGVEYPPAIVVNERDIAPDPMPDTNGAWATTRFVDPKDVRYDMHATIVTFEPGGVIPFAETHVMEHGLYVLEG